MRKGLARRHKGRIGGDVAVALIAVAIMGIARGVYSNELMLFNFMMFFTLAQGLNVVYGFTGYLPFGYVGYYGAGAYGFALAVMHLHVGPLPAMLCSGVAALILGVVLIPLLRLSGAYFAIASLAAAQAVYEVVANPSLQDITKGPYGVSLSGVFAPAFSYYVGLVVMAGTLLLVVYLRNSRFGLSLQAIREDPESAEMAGISVVRGRIIASLLSALIAGLVGGSFAWHISVFYPDSAFDLGISIFAVVFTLFGGITTLTGPLLGVLILYGVYNWIGITVPQYFQLIYGALIMVLVLFLPNGLVSLLTSRGIRVP
ncbi:MAG: branched-chain amino acid ABC transporter permease [Acetobacteraceae bacterium]